MVAGVRDLEPYQRARLGRSAVRAVPGAFAADDLAPALDALRERVERVYLHVDLDVLDSRAGRANEYAAPGGPGPDDVVGAVDAVFDRFAVAAAALTAYDPAEDANGRAREVGRRVIARIRERAAPAERRRATSLHRPPFARPTNRRRVPWRPAPAGGPPRAPRPPAAAARAARPPPRATGPTARGRAARRASAARTA